MNQILDYNPNKSSGGGNSSGSDKIVRVFAVILIIFALCLVGVGAYGVYKNKSEQSSGTSQTYTDAVISFEQGETTGVIKVSHDKVIKKVIYKWDTSKEYEITVDNQSTFEKEIDLNQGKSTITIKVIDIDDHETTYSEVIESAEGKDNINPIIDISVTDDKKLKVTVTDETALDYVTYRWNDEEEETIEADEENPKLIEFEIDILKGPNDFIVNAVDKGANNTNETKSFTGVTKPDVKITIAADKKSADIYCFHENGLTEVTLKINETDYNVDIGTDNPTEVSFSVELGSGNNTITVNAKSVDETNTEVTEEVVPDDDEVEINIERADGSDNATISAKSSAGIKEVKLNVNDVDYNVDIGDQEPTELSFELPLVDGNNKITVKIITVNDTEQEKVEEITK